MIEVEALSKYYGGLRALHDVSFSVGKNEVVGLLGPNGAGKSTTLRILAGFLGPTSGRVRINGCDLAQASLEARHALGYMPETAPLYPEMRVSEYLGFRAALKMVPRTRRAKAVERSLELARAADVGNVVIGQLSKGYRQRVALADALVADPPLLILDEPTAGLDPNQIRDVRTLIRELGKDHAVLVSTHILSEVEAVCDRAIVIHRGEISAQGTVSELRALRSAERAEIRVREISDALLTTAGAIPGVKAAVASTTETLELEILAGANAENVLEAAIAALVGAGARVRHAALVRASLDEVFALVTQSDSGEKSDPSHVAPERSGSPERHKSKT